MHRNDDWFDKTTGYSDDQLDMISQRSAENFMYINIVFLKQFKTPKSRRDCNTYGSGTTRIGKIVRDAFEYGILRNTSKGYVLTEKGKRLVERVGRESKD